MKENKNKQGTLLIMKWRMKKIVLMKLFILNLQPIEWKMNSWIKEKKHL